MKKKRQARVTDSDTHVDLKSMIHQHSSFFDKLVELIPAKFYLSDDRDKPWFQGLSKAQKASAKKESRENIKKARRNRLDPEKSSTTLDLLKKNLEKEKAGSESDDDDDADAKPIMSGKEGENNSVTYEELRQRLRRRIEEYRANRTGRDDGELSARDKKRLEYKAIHEQKRKREGGVEKRNPTIDKVEKDVDEAAKELTFGYVKLGDDEEYGKKKRRLPKSKELEKAKELREAKKDPETGKKHLWSAATSRAAGVKVHDDPKRLKQSLQKDKRKHEKNVEKWKDRTETTQKMKSEKQKKRAGNIAERAKEKKMRKIAKREKKLMRPGFEGRKEGFINQGTS